MTHSSPQSIGVGITLRSSPPTRIDADPEPMTEEMPTHIIVQFTATVRTNQGVVKCKAAGIDHRIKGTW